MKSGNFDLRLNVYWRLFLVVGSTIFSMRAQADETKRAGVEEKSKSIAAAMESSLADLPRLYESVSKSIVRIESADNQSVTGVIVSPEGHILVGNGFVYATNAGLVNAKVHLSDGRTVAATAAGWSIEWRLGVFKINDAGPWPAIKLGSTKNVKAGEPCLVIGYAPRGDANFDPLPMANFGFIDRNEPTRWFTTTCFIGYSDHLAVVSMDGSLLGVQSCSAIPQSYQTAADVFIENRDNLFSGKNLDWIRYPPDANSIYRLGSEHPETCRFRKTDEVLGTLQTSAPMDDAELSDVKQIALKTTVRLVSKDRLYNDGKAYARWSGVIVSEDGYILTCARTDQLPGERLTVRLSDGRDADAVALGTNPITDIGLVKITTPGSWPFAEIGQSSTLKPGDPIVVAGYPATEDANYKVYSTARTPKIGASTMRHDRVMLWQREINDALFSSIARGGMSGGGVFDRQGRYVAIYGEHTRSEVAKLQWNELKSITSIDTATGIANPLRERFIVPSKVIAQSVIEVLVDSKPVSIGTVVGADGWIITKASVLDGKVSCRLPDQSVVVAEERARSQEHDLALLKIDVAGLTAIKFSDSEPPSIAQVLCAVGPDQNLKPGIISVETREVLPTPFWNGDGTVDSQDGVMISKVRDLSLAGTKLKREDIIVSINGHATPTVATLAKVLEEKLTKYCTGDLVLVQLRRKGESINVMTPLPPATGGAYWRAEEYASPRRSGFASVFDSDIELLQNEVGAPVIDSQGRVRGIAIASRGREENQRGPTSILPCRIVAGVTKQLLAEVNAR